ncbi:hypothetical protein [Xanthomonas campestris]|uniref:hypothetical protein n=1 Tax=Xanthomonas campestris TaxID=339 RepID=UPI001E5D563D|nr:hypothetical protein [Xanthomonas campestris]MCC5073948.1 hypothetical protein [Xanthomonas campestris pv. plantaginis]
MHEHQNPMTGFKLLEEAFSQGFRMRLVPDTEDLFVEIDQGLRTERYTYARLKDLEVQQLVVLDENEPLNGLPCFCLFYGTLESLRGQGLTSIFIRQCLNQFKKDLPQRYGMNYYLESLIETENEPSLAIAKKLFGDPSHDGVDQASGVATRIWQFEETR